MKRFFCLILALLLALPLTYACGEAERDYSWLDAYSEEELEMLAREISERLGAIRAAGDEVSAPQTRTDPEEERGAAESVLQKLVFIYDLELDYLEEMNWTWATWKKNSVTSSTIYDAWYTMYFVVGTTEDQQTHGSPLSHFIYYFRRYGVDFKASMDAGDKGRTLIRDVQNSLFSPLRKALGGDIPATVLYIADLMYHIRNMREYLSGAESDLLALRENYPDCAYISPLEAFLAAADGIVSFAETDAGYSGLDAKMNALAVRIGEFRAQSGYFEDLFAKTALKWEMSGDLAFEYEISDAVRDMLLKGTVPVSAP